MQNQIIQKNLYLLKEDLQAVSFHDNRLWFGGVRDKPSAVVGKSYSWIF